jgi:carbonic anhydrase
MLTFTDDEFKLGIQVQTGIKPEWAAESFDLDVDVRQSMARIKASPFVHNDSIRGFVFDVATGKLREVDASYLTPVRVPGSDMGGGAACGRHIA